MQKHLKMYHLDKQLKFLRTLDQLGANSLPENILIGALLEATSHYNRTSDKLDSWAMAGDSFLRGSRTQP